MTRKKMVQATIILDKTQDNPWELSILAEQKRRGYAKRTWDATRRFKDLMSLTSYMIAYPESEGGE